LTVVLCALRVMPRQQCAFGRLRLRAGCPRQSHRPRSIGPKSAIPNWALRTKEWSRTCRPAQAGVRATVVPYH